jgi:hypothetical protein
MKEILWKKILLIGLVAILVPGCLQTNPIKPTKPVLTIYPQQDGGMCLDRQNTKELGEYILNLEQGYK